MEDEELVPENCKRNSMEDQECALKRSMKSFLQNCWVSSFHLLNDLLLKRREL